MGGNGRNDDGVIREQGPPSFWHLVSAIKTVIPRLMVSPLQGLRTGILADQC